jgi:AcrR family transcriptional regulator
MPRTFRKDSFISDIIEAALQEFLSRDYDKVRMEDIAIRAGVRRSNLYRYFPNKDGILAAVNTRFFEPVQVMMNTCGQGDPLAGLRRFIGDYLQFWASHPREQAFYLIGTVKTLQNRVAWPYISARVAEMINWYDMMLSRAVRDGQLTKHDTRSRATTLFCAVEGCIPYVTMSKLLSVKKALIRIDKALLTDLLPAR